MQHESTLPWFVEWEFEYRKDLVQLLSAIPGCTWLPAVKRWRVPIEIAKRLLAQAQTQKGSK